MSLAGSPLATPQQIRRWLDTGYTVCRSSVWTSNIKAVEFQILTGLATAVDVYFCPLTYREEIPLSVYDFNIIHTMEFQFSFRRSHFSLFGNYLRITFPYKSNDAEDLQSRLISIISQARVYLGREVALNEVYNESVNLSDGKVFDSTITGKEGLVRWEPRQLSWHKQSGEKAYGNTFFGIRMSTVAAKFIHAAYETDDVQLRFILLWSAIEAQIGDGRQRKKFCEIELGSPKISSFFKSMHDLRSNYLHSTGIAQIGPKHATMLFGLLRIAVIPDTELRLKLAKLLEEAIDSILIDSDFLPMTTGFNSISMHISKFAPHELIEQQKNARINE